MKDERGLYMKLKGLETKEKVRKYIASNPDAYRKDVCEAIGIGYVTLRKHIKAIESESLEVEV